MKKKKHIENFFITKPKKYKYYYKKNLKKNSCAKIVNANFSKRYQTKVCLKSMEAGYLRPRAMKALLKLIKWFFKKHKIESFYKLNVYPDFVLTSKPSEVRMGKGKGEPDILVAEVKKNQILIEFSYIQNKYLMTKLLTNCKNKLNLKTKIVWNLW